MIKPDHPSVAALARGNNVRAEDVRLLQNLVDAALQEHDQFPVVIGLPDYAKIEFPQHTVEFVASLYREAGWNIRANPETGILFIVTGVL